MSAPTTSPLLTIVSFWQGPVGWLERLCLASVRAAGHRIELYTTDVAALRGEGLAEDVFDVRDVMDVGSAERLYLDGGHLPLFSDIVRLRLQKLGRGMWADCDCLFLAPVAISSPVILGWYPTGRAGNSVIYLERGSPLLDDYYAGVTKVPLDVPWATRRVRLWRRLEAFVGHKLPSNPGRMAIGPRALTYFVEKHGLAASLLPASVFYPVAQADCIELVNPDDRIVSNMLRDDSLMVHAWHTNLKNAGALRDLPPPTSYLGQAYKRFC